MGEHVGQKLDQRITVVDDGEVASEQFEYLRVVSARHANRIVPAVKIKNYQLIEYFTDKQAHVQSFEATLRAPEKMLFDLSNPPPYVSHLSSDNLLISYELAKVIAPSVCEDYGLEIVTGEFLDTELAVSGFNIQNLDSAYEFFKAELLHELKILGITEFSEPECRSIHKVLPIEGISSATHKLYKGYIYFYSKFIHQAYWREYSNFHLKLIYDKHPIWSEINRLQGRKLFVLGGGLPLGLSYLNTTGDKDISFTEVHRQNDSSSFKKIARFDGIFPANSYHSDGWVLIDKSYTGGTLNIVSDMIKEKFGDVNITKIALFPKTLKAVESSDYVVFAGRLIKRSHIRQLSQEFWYCELCLYEEQRK